MQLNDLFELTRNNKNICPTCNKPKQMYYQPWCPRCEKPEFETIKVLNLLQCLSHIESIGGLNNDYMSHIIYDRYEYSNDTYFIFYPINDDARVDEDEKFLEVYDALVDTFGIKEKILFWVSW